MTRVDRWLTDLDLTKMRSGPPEGNRQAAAELESSAHESSEPQHIMTVLIEHTYTIHSHPLRLTAVASPSIIVVPAVQRRQSTGQGAGHGGEEEAVQEEGEREQPEHAWRDEASGMASR